MTALTSTCYDCGVEYVPLGGDPGACPDCGSPATPLTGSPTVLDVRTAARLTDADDATDPDERVLEVVVSDETDRLVVYEVAVPSGAPARVDAVAFDDVVVRRSAETWSPVIVPDVVREAIEARTGRTPAPDAGVR